MTALSKLQMVRDTAIELDRSDNRFKTHTIDELENYVLATGYAAAEKPHSVPHPVLWTQVWVMLQP
jgi:hypothetical protein